MQESSLAIREHTSDAARQALADISDKHGHISPALVVKEAEKVNNPLHDYFKWDDAEAGNLFRLAQARLLIREVKLDIVRRDDKKREISIETSRAYVSPPSIRGGQSYLKLSDAMDNPVLRDEMLERAKRELKSLKDRYKQLDELASVWNAVELI
jgi:transcription-repair coupling factor (superfamily II helicase)